MDAQTLFSRLQGDWSLSRTITPHGRMAGRAVFAPDGDALLYHEEGNLELAGGGAFESFQQYRYRLEKGGINAYFSDGRFFHTLDLKDASATGEHLCKDDLYRVLYLFHDADRFTVTWDVQGPNKDYRIETIYKRDLSC